MHFIQGRCGKNHWVLYLLSIFLVLVAYTIGQTPLIAVVTRAIEKSESSVTVEKFFENPDFAQIGLSNNLGLLLTLLMFVFAMVVLWLVVKFLHKKNFKRLISSSSQVDWWRFGYGFLVWMILMVISELVMYTCYPEVYTFTFKASAFIPLILMCILILPIQTSFEELFFRGYLLQGFYNVVHNKWMVVMVTSLLFALVHGTNPEIRRFGFGVMMSYYTLAGLLLGAITMWDDRLELALGIHAAMNFYGAVFVGYEGAVIQTDAMYKVTDLNPYIMLVVLLISGVLFIVLAKRKYNWNLSVAEETLDDLEI